LEGEVSNFPAEIPGLALSTTFPIGAEYPSASLPRALFQRLQKVLLPMD
jgi:hypothetical protein